MALVAVEWTTELRYENRVRWTTDGETTHVARTLMTALAGLSGTQHVVLCQPAFYSHNRDEEQWLREELAADGDTLVGVSDAALGVLEAEAGIRPSRSRVKRLYRAATAGSFRLDHTTTLRHERYAVRDALDVAYAVGTRAVAPPVARALAALGPYAALDASTQFALGDGLGYDPCLRQAIGVAAAAAPSRDDFELFLGLRATGPRGPMSWAVRSWYVARNTGPAGFERESVLTWTAYRRALRLAYHRINGDRRASETDAATDRSPVATPDQGT